jgi:hypothetical protein
MTVRFIGPTEMHHTRWAEKIPEAIQLRGTDTVTDTEVLGAPLFLYLTKNVATPDRVSFVCFEGLPLLYATLREQGDDKASWMLAALILQFQRGMLTDGGLLYMMQYSTLGAVGLAMSSYCSDCWEKPWDASLMYVMKANPNHCYLCQIPFFDEETK